ncbi:MAG: hypothetical protein WBQ25_20835 [Nitrososphaeraceae archaeon]
MYISRNKYRIAAENPRKFQLVKELISEHEGGEDSILVIGDSIDQLLKGKKRHEFQAKHAFRKWFKTRCEMAGMKPISVEVLMGH